MKGIVIFDTDNGQAAFRASAIATIRPAEREGMSYVITLGTDCATLVRGRAKDLIPPWLDALMEEEAAAKPTGASQ